jgi:phage-related protein
MTVVKVARTERPPSAKPLRGLGSGTVEVVEDFGGDTYRVVYTVRFSEAVYVLHAFKKKSKRGIKTPQGDIDLIRQRVRAAELDHAQRFKKENRR